MTHAPYDPPVHTVTLVPSLPEGKGQRYDAHGPNNELLLKCVVEPVFNACRKMINLGYDPNLPVHFKRSHRNQIDFVISSLKYGATRTVLENQKDGPRIVKYVPMPDNLKAKHRAQE